MDGTPSKWRRSPAHATPAGCSKSICSSTTAIVVSADVLLSSLIKGSFVTLILARCRHRGWNGALRFDGVADVRATARACGEGYSRRVVLSSEPLLDCYTLCDWLEYNTVRYTMHREETARFRGWNLIEFAGAGTIWVVLANNWLRWRGRESSSYCYRSARSRSHQWENAGSTTAGFSCYILCFFDATCNGTLLFWFCIVQRATTYRTVVYNI